MLNTASLLASFPSLPFPGVGLLTGRVWLRFRQEGLNVGVRNRRCVGRGLITNVSIHHPTNYPVEGLGEAGASPCQCRARGRREPGWGTSASQGS